MKLLHMRNAKAFLFDKPIPLLEGEIRVSELFKGLLALDPDPLLHLDDKTTEEIEHANEVKAKHKISNFLKKVQDSRLVREVKAHKKQTTLAAVAEVRS